jgi:hypothetical protein
MTAKTRYFMLGAVLVLVVGLSIGLVAYYGGMPKGLFAGTQGPAELKYLPADAGVVAYANVRAVMGSELRQRLRGFTGNTDEGRSEFKEQTGIDIESDIDHVVACMGPKAAGERNNGLMIARGRFDVGRLEALAKEHNGRLEQYKGKRVILSPEGPVAPEHADAKELAIAFLGPDLIAMGTSYMVHGAIDREAGGASVLGNADLMKLVKDMDTSSLWAVGRFDAMTAQATLPAEVTERIPPITWFSASGHVNGGVQMTLKAETKDDQAASNLRDIVRGFMALAKMQAGNRPEAQALFPDVQLGGEGKTVAVSFGVTTQMLDAFAAGRGAAAGAMKKHTPKPEPKPQPK